jgi:hypothetical protein
MTRGFFVSGGFSMASHTVEMRNIRNKALSPPSTNARIFINILLKLKSRNKRSCSSALISQTIRNDCLQIAVRLLE